MLIFLLTFAACLVILLHLKSYYNKLYWKKRGVVYHQEGKLTGVFWDFLTKDWALFQSFFKIYHTYPEEPVVGIDTFLTPALYVRNPTNIQHMLSLESDSFNHKVIEANNGDLLADNILFSNKEKWRQLRKTLTPIFTPHKLKSMYYIIDHSAQDLLNLFNENPDLMEFEDPKVLATFCCAAVGAAVFGITTKTIFDSPFLEMTSKVFNSNLKRDVKLSMAMLSQRLFKIFNIQLFTEYENFFIGAVKQCITRRKIEDVKKYDYIDLCVALQTKVNDVKQAMTDEQLAAQGFIFYVAGVETTTNFMFAILVELGKHPDILERLHQDIDKMFTKCDGKITYEAITELEYLDMIMYETLRMHPPASFLFRKCVKDSILPVGNIKVDKGTTVYLPVYEIHHDPKYYPNPDIFDPERFSSENKHSIPDACFFPFGMGPRICLGMRYALLQSKAGLAHLLHKFTVKTTEFNGGAKYKKDFVQMRLINVSLKLTPRNKQ